MFLSQNSKFNDKTEITESVTGSRSVY